MSGVPPSPTHSANLTDGRSPQEIVKQSVIEVSTRELFDLEGGGRKPKRNGALDARMVANPEGRGVNYFSTNGGKSCVGNI